MLLRKIQRRLSRDVSAKFLTNRSQRSVEERFISVCFDDFPLSAASTGASILKEFGAVGTYYFSAGLAGAPSVVGPIASLESAHKLLTEGHEIGCHTFGHRDCTSITKDELLLSLEKNKTALNFCSLESFSFPFGYWDWQSKSVVSQKFCTARTGLKGVNKGFVDLAGLRSIPLYEPQAVADIDFWLQELKKDPAWVIFYTHDVVENPSKFGCTPDSLRYCLQRASDMGYRIDTVGAVARRLM